ncbi:hypothetical protein MMC13_003513 [Lambiella insularis]|nr:hypothetical protein [Lambiella insularis]
MSLTFWLICVYFSFLQINALPIACNNDSSVVPVATVLNGSYYGVHSASYNQDFFLGIPFAQPPVGDLRLRLPASLNTTWKQPRNATEYGYACIGYGEDTQIGASNYVSEDCLTLNIVRPAGHANKKLPVAVWIYGGGFYEGSSRDPRYNLSFIVQQAAEVGKPFIGVSINYRLHGLGFLWSEEIVQAGENIHDFGGNPSNVTIWGESAGAISVGLHLLAYNGRDDGLFSGAIAESGPPSGAGLLNPTTSLAEVLYKNITAAAGCSNVTDRLACLRLLSTKDLDHILSPITGEDNYQIYFGPLVDGDIIARGGNAQLLNGAFVKVPFILGENSDDGTDFPPFGINNDTGFADFFSGFDLDQTTLNDLMKLYPNTPNDDIPLSAPGVFNETVGFQFKRAATLIGDMFFKSPRRLAAQQWNKHTNVSLYSYRFNAIPNGIPNYYGVTHWQEVPFVFHNIEGSGFPNIDPPYFGPDPFANRSQLFFDLATLMSRMWAAFIHDGNPNYFRDGTIQWPEYTLTNPTNFVFDANVTSYLEEDSYRSLPIQYLVHKYESRAGPFLAHDMS